MGTRRDERYDTASVRVAIRDLDVAAKDDDVGRDASTHGKRARETKHQISDATLSRFLIGKSRACMGRKSGFFQKN